MLLRPQRQKAPQPSEIAFVTMLMVPAAPTGYVYGAIVDVLKPQYGAATAFRTSFVACAWLMLSGILLAITLLPARPQSTLGSPDAPAAARDKKTDRDE